MTGVDTRRLSSTTVSPWSSEDVARMISVLPSWVRAKPDASLGLFARHPDLLEALHAWVVSGTERDDLSGSDLTISELRRRGDDYFTALVHLIEAREAPTSSTRIRHFVDQDD